MKPIGDAAASVIPSGMGIWKGYGLEVASLNSTVAVWKEGDARCCPTGGSVEVQFRIVHGTIEITSKHYTPAN
jgi:hypothetical protein